MESYAADVYRSVKEALPAFEPHATECMKLTCILAGLDQELHGREVKTFQKAFEIATQVERARQAAKLLPPTPSVSSGGATARSVSII